MKFLLDYFEIIEEHNNSLLLKEVVCVSYGEISQNCEIRHLYRVSQNISAAYRFRRDC